MLKVLLLFLCADTFLGFNLHFDRNQYEDLLVSISPDITGSNLKPNFYIIDHFLRGKCWRNNSKHQDMDHWGDYTWFWGYLFIHFLLGKQLPLFSKSGMGQNQSGVLCIIILKFYLEKYLGLHSPSLLMVQHSGRRCSPSPWGCWNKSGGYQQSLWRHSLYLADWRMWRSGRSYSGNFSCK